MHIKTRNINTAFRKLLELFHEPIRRERPDLDCVRVVSRPSRNGNVLMIDEPVTITYSHPRERVLFNAARDANPFFHLYQALWMLAGRNDVAPLAYYAKKNLDYSDDGKTLNGAYGYRWRHAIERDGEVVERTIHDELRRDKRVDQLDVIVNHLKADPNSRRAVLQMWSVEDDLLKIGSGKLNHTPASDVSVDLQPGYKSHLGKSDASKDVCCNLSVMLSLRESERAANLSILNLYPEQKAERWGKTAYELDMTVTNRSNDLVWGMLGTDYVDFVFLQEYMAARLGAEVGVYHHFTNNLHAYEWNWKPEEWLSQHELMHDQYKDIEDGKLLTVIPLIKDPTAFERELPLLVETFSGDDPNRITTLDYTEPFLKDVACPVLMAFAVHKYYKDTERAIRNCSNIIADDWRTACTQWLQRRANRVKG